MPEGTISLFVKKKKKKKKLFSRDNGRAENRRWAMDGCAMVYLGRMVYTSMITSREITLPADDSDRINDKVTRTKLQVSYASCVRTI